MIPDPQVENTEHEGNQTEDYFKVEPVHDVMAIENVNAAVNTNIEATNGQVSYNY